ncbi:aldehyde dehydrogenase family protein [Pararoseomonas sp. SCSIO 73927]|uniref:aldehyde dehydrogenase family protein n=1 Tax=Pararoseomonas sp. SCSIO 73927 TaxID=3114537 RepID=UPI0030D17C75
MPLDHPVPTGLVLPQRNGLFYDGAWHAPLGGRMSESVSPATGKPLGQASVALAEDVDAAVAAAQAGFREWRRVPPLERAKILRRIAAVIREHGAELAMLDAADGGNPVTEMRSDADVAANLLEFHAGLVTEMKGHSVPMGPDAVNFTMRQPYGVVARIVAFNHPFMFSAGRMAAPLAAGNAVIMKPPEQAPLSGLRLAELVGGLLPRGVFGLITGGREAGEALAAHPGVAMVTLIGSVPTGRAVMRGAAERLKPVLLELGGKNALIAFPDADPDEVAAGAVQGMNYTWCGQSCGSMSRVFLHDSIHDAVVERIRARIAHFRPGMPTDPATTMGAIVSRAQYDRVLGYIEAGRAEGARLLCGGGPPADPALRDGLFIEPTVFTGVRQSMRIASEEIFGPVQSVLRWTDEAAMLAEVNSVEYGLTCAIYTNDVRRAHRMAAEVEAGYVWINKVSTHFLGTPFGGWKQSGIGRDECLEELLFFTQEKNVHVNLKAHGA